MLSEDQIASIAAKLNERVDLPFLDEEREQQILEGVVGSLNGKLATVTEALPEPVQEIWNSLAEGVSDGDAETLIESLTEQLNEQIDIPLLDEEKEADMIIRPVVRTIVDTLRGDE